MHNNTEPQETGQILNKYVQYTCPQMHTPIYQALSGNHSPRRCHIAANGLILHAKEEQAMTAVNKRESGDLHQMIWAGKIKQCKWNTSQKSPFQFHNTKFKICIVQHDVKVQ